MENMHGRWMDDGAVNKHETFHEAEQSTSEGGRERGAGLNQQSQTSVKEARGVAFICVVGGGEREGGREGTRDREDQGCRIGALHYFTAGVLLQQLRSAFAFLSGFA